MATLFDTGIFEVNETQVKLHKLIAGLLLVGCLINPLSAQNVYPGDINNNGIVNQVDALYLGVAHGATGPVRPNASTTFNAQPLGAPWAQSFPNGLNYAYADADGNGVVDRDDLEKGISDNIGLTHGTITPDPTSEGKPGADPSLRVNVSSNVTRPGAALNVEFSLGSPAQPVNNFYGIAFVIAYDPAKIQGGELEFEYEDNTWTGEKNNDVFLLTEKALGPGRTQVAITRNNQRTVSGSGIIGTAAIIIEDIVLGRQVDTLPIRIEEVLMINEQLTPTAVGAEGAVILITENGELPTGISADPGLVQAVFPVPAQDQIQIQLASPLQQEAQIKLVDIWGRQHLLGSQSPGWTQVNAAIPKEIPQGWYLLLLIQKDGAIVGRAPVPIIRQ